MTTEKTTTLRYFFSLFGFTVFISTDYSLCILYQNRYQETKCRFCVEVVNLLQQVSQRMCAYRSFSYPARPPGMLPGRTMLVPKF